MDKDHLKRLRLKLGVEITIWNEIEKERKLIKQSEHIKPESTSVEQRDEPVDDK